MTTVQAGTSSPVSPRAPLIAKMKLLCTDPEPSAEASAAMKALLWDYSSVSVTRQKKGGGGVGEEGDCK